MSDMGFCYDAGTSVFCTYKVNSHGYRKNQIRPSHFVKQFQKLLELEETCKRATLNQPGPVYYLKVGPGPVQNQEIP